jgi:hypothetical protein
MAGRGKSGLPEMGAEREEQGPDRWWSLPALPTTVARRAVLFFRSARTEIDDQMVRSVVSTPVQLRVGTDADRLRTFARRLGIFSVVG